MRWSHMYLATIYPEGPSSKNGCRSAADLYTQIINKVAWTNDMMFECITALCFIHGL